MRPDVAVELARCSAPEPRHEWRTRIVARDSRGMLWMGVQQLRTGGTEAWLTRLGDLELDGIAKLIEETRAQVRAGAVWDAGVIPLASGSSIRFQATERSIVHAQRINRRGDTLGLFYMTADDAGVAARMFRAAAVSVRGGL